MADYMLGLVLPLVQRVSFLKSLIRVRVRLGHCQVHTVACSHWPMHAPVARRGASLLRPLLSVQTMLFWRCCSEDFV